MSFFKQHWRALLLAAALAVGALNIFGCGGKSDGAKGESGTFTDSRDGKVYKTVTIGGKNWMAENLNYNGGNSVCYDNNDSNCDKYGRLYDCATAKTICPTGWHLPDEKDWVNLIAKAGDCPDGDCGKNLRSKSGWNDANANGTDALGFSALPGGGRTQAFDGDVNGFGMLGSIGTWWTVGDGDDCRHGEVAAGETFDSFASICDMLSVRCVQD